MRKLIVFNQMSLDGYVAGVNGDTGWFKTAERDPEWDGFVAGNASGGGTLVFGRITYEMMAGFWTTPAAAEQFPVVAQQMNDLPKIVFSRTLGRASWGNTTLVQDDLAAATRSLKEGSGPDMVILGSASIVAQLARTGLIDEYQVVLVPVALGGGKTMFHGLEEKLSLRLTKTRVFANGNVLLCYQPRT